MSATVVLISYHGVAGATETDITSGTLRYKTADNTTVDANNPIPVITSSTSRSYLKQVALKCTGAPANNITNAKFYTDGSASATGWSGNVDVKARVTTATTGTASSGTSNTLTSSGFTTNAFQNYMIELTGGTGSGQKKTIASNTTTVITISGTFSPVPDNTSTYRIEYIDPTAWTTTALDGSPASAFTFTFGSSLDLVAGTFTGTGRIGKYVVSQMEVTDTASPGTLGSETFTWAYDES
jgi:hypothetical protein